MHLELNCCNCGCTFVPNPRNASTLEMMDQHGPWYALGDGETLEDMMFNTFFSEDKVHCEDCGEPVDITQEGLGRLTLAMLGGW